MSFEIIKTEYTQGLIGNSDYGSRVRVVMRSPTHFLFSGYGLHYRIRSSKFFDRGTIARDAKRKTLECPEVSDRIDKLFGDGATNALIQSTMKRGYGTVLVNGGGDALPLPRNDARKLHDTQYGEITPYYDVMAELSKEHCLQCGKPLRIQTAHHHVPWLVDQNKAIRTLEQCQRLSNHPVVAMHGVSSNRSPEYWPNVEWFETWDGESYQQEIFCSDKCAATYGFRAAAELPHLLVGGERKKHALVPRQNINHGDEEVRTFLLDGKPVRY